jgi:exodeoxyribonuclease VII large subunit
VSEPADARPTGIQGSGLQGPFSVGAYAAQLRDRLRGFTKVQVFGEACNVRVTQKNVYFELRDERGGLSCSMWRNEYDQAGVVLENGAQVVIAGGCDYYPGSATSSPSFSFRATALRIAGEGELLAQIERLRKQLAADGLAGDGRPQQLLPLPALPRSIGVVTGETGKARDDVLAGLRRRGWAGRLVWAFAPVQDRRAAPAIARAVQDLAAVALVDVIVVTRGGGSVMDLMAFSDETLCRTIALLSVPVVASVGHHTDRTLIDDVAAVAASTPTHAAEAAVRTDVTAARATATAAALRLQAGGSRAVVDRARRLASLARAPAEHLARHRARLHQQARELRAAGARRVEDLSDGSRTHALVLDRKRAAAAGPDRDRRGRELERLRSTLAAHDPDRTLERGFALVETPDGGVVTTAATARAAGSVSIRFHDDRVSARIEDE